MTMMQSPKLAFDPPIIAHRGASISAPENTLAAFLRAIALGVKWVEFDVVLAACGEAIVYHDKTLNRTTNAKGYLKDYTYERLKTLDAGSWFGPEYANEKIPTLLEVLTLIKKANINANIELKPLPGQDKQLVDHVVKLVDSFNFRDDQILYSSFSLQALRYLRELRQDVHIGLLLYRWRKNWKELSTELNCVSIHVHVGALTKKRAHLIKDTGDYLLVYTVNTVHVAKLLFDYGVDAIFTDDPQTILTSLSN